MRKPMDSASGGAIKAHVSMFAIPVLWLAFVGLAALLHLTAWGREGHPSNSTILFIYALLGAPVLGLIGGVYASLRGGRYPKPARVAAVLLNAGVVVAGMWFWMLAGST
jgi:hypothetical protein